MTKSPARSDSDDGRSAANQVADWLDSHGEAVHVYARRRVESEQVAEELVQETFLAALQNFDSFAGRSSPKTWLIAILRNKLINYYRERSRRRQQPLDLDVGDQCFNSQGIWKVSVGNWPRRPDQTIESQEFWQAFDDCVSKLPSSSAEAFILRVFDDLDTENICKTLDISTTNLAVRLHRARLALRNCLEKNWFGGD